MRARIIPVTALALAAGSCFQIDPLPDCEDGGGEGALYVRSYVCMPLAGEPLEMPVAPRQLLRADFDDEGVDNDFAVLLDLGKIQIFTTRGQKTAQAAVLDAGARIEAITAARYFSQGDAGDDLIGVIRGNPMNNTPGTVFGFHNGGDMFAETTPETISAFTLLPIGVCPAPNSVATMDLPGMALAFAVAVGCESGPPPMEMPMDEPLDGILIRREDGKLFDAHARVGLKMPQLVGVHAVNVAQLDGLELEDIVLAHTPAMAENQSLAVYPVTMAALSGVGPPPAQIDVSLEHGSIQQVLLDDLDGDADIDIVAIHPEGRGITVVRQKRSEPLDFEDPQFFDISHAVLDAVIGDFTGDGQVDIAVAHEVDDTGLNTISLLIRTPDLAPGKVDYAPATAASISGEIVDLESLDYDGDGRTDIVAVVKVGSEGRVHFWLNRSPTGE